MSDAEPRGDASLEERQGETPSPGAGEPEAVASADVEPDAAGAAEADAPAAEAQPSRAPALVPDERLLEAHDLALEALREITDPATVGDPAGHRVEEDGVVSLLFENRMLGYPGWYWTVSLAVVEGADPTVLEAELLPGDDALLAPEWVPWAVRLKEFQAAQAAAAASAGADAEPADEHTDDAETDVDDEDADGGLELDEDDDLDEDELDDDDFDADGSPILHSGDVDGVDIDELDEGEGRVEDEVIGDEPAAHDAGEEDSEEE